MRKIINLFKNKLGSKAEFEELFRPHLNHLYRIAYRLTGNVPDAEDLTQEVLLKVYPDHHQINKDKIRPWLTTVTYRTFIDQKRKAKRTPFSWLTTSSHEDNEDIIDTIASDNSGPEEIATQKSLDKYLDKALAMLNEEQRSVCVLHDMEGYTLAELVFICDTPLGTLKSRLHRARSRLRKILSGGAFLDLISS